MQILADGEHCPVVNCGGGDNDNNGPGNINKCLSGTHQGTMGQHVKSSCRLTTKDMECSA